MTAAECFIRSSDPIVYSEKKKSLSQEWLLFPLNKNHEPTFMEMHSTKKLVSQIKAAQPRQIAHYVYSGLLNYWCY